MNCYITYVKIQENETIDGVERTVKLTPFIVSKIQSDTLKWAAEQIVIGGNPEVARDKIIQEEKRLWKS